MKTSLLSWSMVLVATALVACGDDDATGTGGAGGAGGAATTSSGTQAGPTSVSAATGTPASSSVQASVSASSGEGAGGSGQGGEPGNGGSGPGNGGSGQGGNGAGGAPGDCEATVDITDVAFDAQNGGYLGFLDPNIGAATTDLGFVVFPNSAATIDLSDPASAAIASVQGYEDFDLDAGAFNGAFFVATEGTISVAANGWEVSGARLFEADPDTFELVAGGRCLDVNDVSGDVQDPFGWTCDPTFYDMADGCDCECGIYDPDCDIVDPPQTIYNCAPGQTCGDDATCEGAPTAWTCDDAAYEDGTTCNCDCGVVDPDCADAGNEIEGCAVGEACTPSGVCAAPETICNDLLDNDEDGTFDCDDTTSCQGVDASCTPGAGLVGTTCDANNDCAASDSDPICLSEALFDLNDGACSEWCDLAANDCPGGGLCLTIGLDGRGVCAPSCEDNGDCRADATCIGTAPAAFCLPGTPACFDDNEDLAVTDSGTTIDGNAGPSGTCLGLFEAPGANVVYDFTSGAAGTYTFTLQSATDQGMSLRTTCGDDASELGCTDLFGGGTDEVLVVDLAAATSYTVIVQAFLSGEEGDYTITVDAP